MNLESIVDVLYSEKNLYKIFTIACLPLTFVSKKLHEQCHKYKRFLMDKIIYRWKRLSRREMPPRNIRIITGNTEAITRFYHMGEHTNQIPLKSWNSTLTRFRSHFADINGNIVRIRIRKSFDLLKNIFIKKDILHLVEKLNLFFNFSLIDTLKISDFEYPKDNRTGYVKLPFFTKIYLPVVCFALCDVYIMIRFKQNLDNEEWTENNLITEIIYVEEPHRLAIVNTNPMKYGKINIVNGMVNPLNT